MSSHFDGFVPIHTVFYSVFHPTEGTKVRYQFPPANLENNDINFDTIKNYVIPKPQLCNKLLTFKYGPYRLACYPVNVNASYYARNSFNFNFVFVFPYNCATSPYEPAVARLGKMFRVLEEQSQILSKAENDPVYFHLKSQESSTNSSSHPVDQGGSDRPKDTEQGTGLNISQDSKEQGKIEGQGAAIEKYHEIMDDLEKGKKRLSIEDLITKLYQDLNNYSECFIPIDSGNSVDIKLFPLLAPPNSCLSFEDVPISTVNLAKLIDVNWDPTMLKIVPFINGVNSIAKISKFSSSDTDLVIECVKHLIYYNCVVLADIFQFSNIYASTSLISEFLTDPTLASECQTYVTSSDLELYRLPFESRPNLLAMHSSRKQNSSSTIHTVSVRTSPNRTNSLDYPSELSTHRNNFSSSSASSLMRVRDRSGQSTTGSAVDKQESRLLLPTKSCLFDLYRSLHQGETVKEWYKINFEIIRDNHIDVRRFITFGIVRGLIYRCYAYPVMKNLGALEMLKTLKSASDSRSLRRKLKFREKKNFTNNVFSTADIKVDLEHSPDGAPAEIFNRKHTSNVDMAEEVLKDAYKKLSIIESMDDNLYHVHNPMSRLYGHDSGESSTKGSRKGSSSTMESETRSKVAFEKGRSPWQVEEDEKKERTEEVSNLLKEKRHEEFLLLKSVKSVDTFDKICMRLEKDREEVEQLLKAMGHYNIINS